MEPLRLRLRNFGSYRDADIDLSTLSLAAITGQNGAGKSTIVDAMLWAAFGQASKGGLKSLDDYVTRGQAEGQVEFTFALGGRTYVILRRRSVAKQKTWLELSRVDAAGPVPMSGRTIDETQQAIERLLRMNYESFTASCVILQGGSGTFTGQMSDAQRRQVLGGILGLDVYGALRDEAAQRAQDARQTAADAQRERQAMETLAGTLSERESALAAGMAAAENVERDAGTVAQAVEGAVAAQARAAGLQQQAQAKAQEILRLQAEHGRADDAVRALALESAGLQDIIATRVPQAEAVLATATAQAVTYATVVDAEESLLQKAEARALAARAVHAQAEDQRAVAARLRTDKSRREGELTRLENTIQNLQGLLARGTAIRRAAADVAALDVILAEMDARLAMMRTAEAELNRRALEHAAWGTLHAKHRAGLEADLHACEEQAGLTGEVPCQGTDLQPACKLLAGAMAAAERAGELRGALAHLETEYFPGEVALQTAAERVRHIRYDAAEHADAKAGRARVAEAAREITALAAAEAQATALGDRRAADAAALAAVAADLLAAEEKLCVLADEDAATGEVVASAERMRLACQQRRRAAQEAAAAQAKAEAGLDEAKRAVEQARLRLAGCQVEYLDAFGRTRELAQDIAATRDAEAELTTLASQEALHARQLPDLRLRLEKVRAEGRMLQEAAGQARAQVQQAQDAAVRLPGLRDQEAAAQGEAVVSGYVQQAFEPRGGVPALILENAVPQIEGLANGMLRGMAGGRLAVRLVTQRETKGGTTAEALRVLVLDGGQEREYVTFSGGERLLVDVALRVALSRFLAHRAGAEIQMLVMDEGLGSLDAANRGEMLAAFQAVSRQFKRVLVLTHIPEVQDLLPQRLEVERGPDGYSQAKIVA